MESFSFWDYSCERYTRPGVAAICLKLQDQCGLDVNLVLFCIWLGENRRIFHDTEDFCSRTAAARQWQKEVVQPVRIARLSAKPLLADVPGDTYQAIKTLELEIEQTEQWLLFRSVSDMVEIPEPHHQEKVREAAIANLVCYLSIGGIDIEAIEDGPIADLLTLVLD